MIRPDSRRKTCSTALGRSPIPHDWRSVPASSASARRSRLSVCELVNGTNFDTAAGTPAAGRNFAGPFECFVEVRAIENVVSGELLFGFGEGTIGHHRLAVQHADRGGSGSEL